MKLFTGLALAIAAALTFAAGDVAAQTVVGTTTGAPTYNRTISGTPPPSLSGVGTDVNYFVQPFTVTTTGAYSLANASVYDGFLSLYQGAFVPTTPLANILVANDDSVTSNSLINTNLSTGVQYFAVQTAFDNGDAGAFTLTFAGPAPVVLGVAAATPEPAAWAMLIGGFGLAGGALRSARRRRAAVLAA